MKVIRTGKYHNKRSIFDHMDDYDTPMRREPVDTEAEDERMRDEQHANNEAIRDELQRLLSVLGQD